MPSANVVPSSDITTTDWANTGSGSFSATLAASSGTGDGTHYVDETSGVGGTNDLVVGCTFSTTGISSITGVTYTVHWQAGSKATCSFQLWLYSNGGSTELASMASSITTTSTSEITSGPTSMTINDATVSDWTNFQMKIASGTGGNSQGDFFGLYVTITYTAAVAGIYSESCVTGGAVQTTGLIGLTPAFVVGQATIGSRNFW